MANNVYEDPNYLDSLSKSLSILDRNFGPLPKKDTLSSLKDRIAVIQSAAQYTEKVTCGRIKNCSMCCHDTIYTNPVEAEVIIDYIKENNIQFNKDRMYKQVIAENYGDLTWEEKACPMLSDIDDNGQRLCSIYEVRPLICRTHNSIDPPENCDRSENPNKVIGEAKIAELDAINFYLVGTMEEIIPLSQHLLKL